MENVKQIANNICAYLVSNFFCSKIIISLNLNVNRNAQILFYNVKDAK